MPKALGDRSKLGADTIAKLDANFRKQDYHRRHDGFTSIKAAAVIIRLHEAFGRANIQIDGDYTIESLPDFPIWAKGEDGRGRRIIGSYTQHLLTFKGRLHITAGGKVTESFVIPLFGMRRLDDKSLAGQTFEDIAKSVRTNAISKAVFEHLLIGANVYRGEVEANKFGATNLPPTEEEIEEEQAAHKRGLIRDWMRGSKDNAAKAKELIVQFKTDNGIAPDIKLSGFTVEQTNDFYSIWKDNT